MIAANVPHLPDGESPDLVLVPATPQERIAAIKLNSVAWKGPLDIDAYIAREDHLHNHQLVREGMTCWILVDGSEPEGDRTILSSCETYPKKALLAYQGQVEEVSTHGIGSVYSRPEFRGKGYAKRMMEELGKKLETWKMEKQPRGKTSFTILFSDIGKKFYAQFGWRPYAAAHMVLPARAMEDTDQVSESNGTSNRGQTRDLLAEDVERTMCHPNIIADLRDELQRASSKSQTAQVAILPDYDHYSWHWAREEFFVQELYPDRSPPLIKGAGNDAAHVYCTWNRNFGDTPESSVLYILRWVYDKPKSADDEQSLIQAMVDILRRAQHEAKDWGLATVEFWNPDPILQKAVQTLDSDVQVEHREKSSIPSLRWTGDKHGLGQEVEWVLNEKYAWC
ncbi:Uncharacterized protein PECH_000446 [Penicillium ucsense]|uniref:N-acetyltransferase domain-containing protein n=1 Tax=Penicillium ucsense TaxID=2839758 RepID=A0A8J8WJ92_9EURO|nr:Uncharacterized protein PECM_007212 [Penicillium ucsense]KAF7733603.1 Uncharacterized protein PECH_000446 [Penicillium ucsense]